MPGELTENYFQDDKSVCACTYGVVYFAIYPTVARRVPFCAIDHARIQRAKARVRSSRRAITNS